MKRLWIILLFPLAAWGQMHEILRPTADNNAPSNTLGSACTTGTVAGTSAMPNSWDAAGLSTQSTQTVFVNTNGTKLETRSFGVWGTTTNTYAVLTLNINSSAAGPTGTFAQASAALAYSTNNGTTWTTILSDTGSGWTQQTSTITLSPSQILGNLLVAVCLNATGLVTGGVNYSSRDSVTIWDIWTDGIYSITTPSVTPPPATVPQPVLISRLRKHFL